MSYQTDIQNFVDAISAANRYLRNKNEVRTVMGRNASLRPGCSLIGVSRRKAKQKGRPDRIVCEFRINPENGGDPERFPENTVVLLYDTALRTIEVDTL